VSTRPRHAREAARALVIGAASAPPGEACERGHEAPRGSPREAEREQRAEGEEPLYGAVDDGALDVRLPRHARKERETYLDCGLLCRGFARIRCGTCEESRLVGFSCEGRGFCPSCLGRRMCRAAANLIEQVLPEAALRQWVLTFPSPWRARLPHDGELLGALTRIFVESVSSFHAKRASARRSAEGKTGAVAVIQRISSDLRSNPHHHVVFLDGVYREEGASLVWTELGHLKTREVGEVLEHAVLRMSRHLRRRGLLGRGSPRRERPSTARFHVEIAAARGARAPVRTPARRRGRAARAPLDAPFGP
jgi:hypothetical protein